MDSRSDAELARALQAGEAAAFEAFYVRYSQWVVSLAFRFTGNRDDALDVLQETFAYLHRKRRTFELRCQMKSFLYPVIKHLALARKQASRRHTALEAGVEPPSPESRPSEVGPLLEGLTDAQQEVVLLRFVDGLDLQGIADSLAIPLGTVKSRLHSALAILRERNFPNR